MAELSVKIGADIRDLQKNLSKSEKELKDLGTQAKRTGNDVEKALMNGAKVGKPFQKSLNDAGKGMQKLGAETKGAVPTLTSFSQVIQDAPYGIRGVANNITQLTSQFGYLSKSAGGTKAALKAMLGTMAGPAGILFAVSAITSLLVSFGDELLTTAGSTDELAEASKEFTSEAKAEVTQLQALVAIAQNDANSKGVRERAVKKLNEKYKDYLGNLDLESIKSAKTKTAVDELSKSILRQAQIRGINKLIEEKSLELAEAEIDAQKDAQREGKKESTRIKGRIKDYREQREAFATFGKDYKKTQDSIADIARNKTISKVLNEETGEIKQEIDELVSFLQTKLVDQLNFEDLFGDDTTDEQYKKEKAFAEKKRKLFDKIEQDIRDDEFEALKSQLKAVESIYEKSGAKAKDEMTIDQDTIKVEEIANELLKIAAKIKQLKKVAENLDVSLELDSLSLEQLDIAEQKLSQIRDIQRLLKSEGINLNINLGDLDLSQLNSLQAALVSTQETANIVTNALGASFSALGQQLSQSMSTGVAAIDAFTSSLISQLARITAELAANFVTEKIFGSLKASVSGTVAQAQGVQIATQAAAALGPFGIAALPGLLATTQAQITAALALAKAPKFATGGFSGDNTLAYLNRQELVLRPQEQAALYNVLRGGMSSMMQSTVKPTGTDEIVGTVVLRGNNQVIQLRRAEKRMNKYYN